jgi:hypothetical protein
MQDDVVSLIGTNAHILERLRMLTEDDGHYGSLLDDTTMDGDPSIKDRLVSKSYSSLCLIQKDIAGSVLALEQVRDGMDRLLRNARNLVHQRCRGGSYRNRSMGPIPSVDACLEGIERIVGMYGRETTLCKAAACDMLPAISVLSGCVQGNETNSIVETLRDIVRKRYCVDSMVTQQLIYKVKATIEDERF